MNLTHRQFEILIAAAESATFSAAAARSAFHSPRSPNPSAASNARSVRGCSSAPPDR
jgi:hypothetical protein